ncbi:MAG TPA: hypothetical protein VMB50_08280 [Myxococcales bacterium]|nr:hypothetical protein [Myxococcales bacterium]
MCTGTLVVLLLLGTAARAQAVAPDGGPSDVSALTASFSDLLALIQDVPSDRWAGAARARCHPVPGEGTVDSPLEHPSEPYCSLCEVEAGSWRGSYFFYADLDRDACTLQGAVLVGTLGKADPQAALDAAQPLVGRRLAGLGPGAELRHRTFLELGSAGWSRTWHWGKQGATDAYLYLAGLQPSPLVRAPSLGFQWRRVPEDMRPRPRPKASNAWPDLLSACAEVGVSHGDPSDPAAVRKALDDALAALRGSRTPDARWPALAACTWALAQRLVEATPEADRKRLGKTLGDPRLGLSYEELGASWNVDLALPRELALKRPDSRWGQRAFLAMLPSGFADGCCCAGGADTFRPMISHGEKFLAAFPRSPVAPDVEKLVAEAYETWWSLHLVTHSQYVSAGSYASGAEHARLEALRHFDRLAKPWSRELRLATFLLRHRLYAGAPHYCIYD